MTVAHQPQAEGGNGTMQLGRSLVQLLRVALCDDDEVNLYLQCLQLYQLRGF